MDRDSQIVIGSDGTVLAATDDLPPGLVDVSLEHCTTLSREVRDAGKALLSQLRRSGGRVLSGSLALDGGSRSVHLVAVEALAVRRTATDLRALLASKLAVVSSQAVSAGVALDVAVTDDVPAAVQVDTDKIAWAVTTLVGNALRYVRSGSRRMPGGTIGVRATFDPSRSQLTIAVQDDGPGIQADTVARLFKRDGLDVRGAGLALLLMSEICAAHGGTINVQSSVDASSHGTTVTLTLPV